MKKLYIIGVLVFISIAYFATREVAGQPQPPPTPHAILDAINNLQNTVNNLMDSLEDVSHIPRAWSRKLPTAERFVLVLDNEAVLDKETGLVWERTPDGSRRTWRVAHFLCNNKAVGGRKGWRVSTLQELTSLADTSQFFSPALPAGHPFDNVVPDFYWSATTASFDADVAWVVDFLSGSVSNVGTDKDNEHFVWCVRGGQGVDPQ